MQQYLLIFKTFFISVFFLLLSSIQESIFSQGIIFNRHISPAEGWVKPVEKPYRREICLNGKWDFQPIDIPKHWEYGNGVPPELPLPTESGWEKIKIKIPSPWNVNDWGGGSTTGADTEKPYAPSSLYFPSYPPHWEKVQMGWLRRYFEISSEWPDERIILHFEAIIGDCVILINGQKVTTHFGGYLPFEVDITHLVRKGKANELLIGIRHRKLFDKTDKKYPYFRSTYSPGSNTDNLVGIWQDVYLLGVPNERITNVFVKPWVDRDQLEFEVTLINQTSKIQHISLSGQIKEWLNKSGNDVLSAPEINWELGHTAIELPEIEIVLLAGEQKKVTLIANVNGRLKYWSPRSPNLYTVIFQIKGKGKVLDCKTERFGWRQVSIREKDFYLNGERIQCVGDIQHPFGAYICSRRFAWAWYKMIKDFGGNCVRLHAQPWPRFYYDLADEMGIMVLDESALFGSSLSLNFQENITWSRTEEHIVELVLRDRNHPSVIGWSIGNELFAIPLYNKVSPEIARVWNEKIIELSKRIHLLDPTRSFITVDGDEDLNGFLPIWSKHFGHGLQLDRLPSPEIGKPLVVGECGATYYGTPSQLFPFIGEKAYMSYYGRNEALAVDIYQNAVHMARPHLAYFSPSEVCWFGIEHMNLGYHDYSRLPDAKDGIFAGIPYEEGKPGYQIERIPPYVSTFNPGLDPDLPLYQPLPMFQALKAAFSEEVPQPCEWDTFYNYKLKPKPEFQKPVYKTAYFMGENGGILSTNLRTIGVKCDTSIESSFVIVDGEHLTLNQLNEAVFHLNRMKNDGGLMWIMLSDGPLSPHLSKLLPAKLNLTDRYATSLQSDTLNFVGKYFYLPDLYFSEMEGDCHIIKQGMDGELVKMGEVVMEATNVDWSLFNQVPENRKCAQVVLYEHLHKPSGVALIRLSIGKLQLWVSTIDYKIMNKKTIQFWRNLARAMGVNINVLADINQENSDKEHDLLMDGPIK